MPTRYFLTYRGVKLPLQLAEELAPDALANRNTWFRADYDDQGRLVAVDKLVYGEVELSHRYAYDAHGRLVSAVVAMGDEEPVQMEFPAAVASRA